LAEWPELHLGALLRALVDGGVDFVVIGGIAAVGHGSPQFTRDLDIAYAGDDANLRRLGDVLVALGARLRGVTEDVPFLPDGRTLRDTRVLCLETAEGQLDVLAEPDGSGGYARLRANAIEATVSGVTVRIAGLDDLIAMKRAAGRPKDRIYIEELEAIRRLRRERGLGP
jgi:predicted nucleotidyltransferase